MRPAPRHGGLGENTPETLGCLKDLRCISQRNVSYLAQFHCRVSNALVVFRAPAYVVALGAALNKEPLPNNKQPIALFRTERRFNPGHLTLTLPMGEQTVEGHKGNRE